MRGGAERGGQGREKALGIRRRWVITTGSGHGGGAARALYGGIRLEFRESDAIASIRVELVHDLGHVGSNLGEGVEGVA